MSRPKSQELPHKQKSTGAAGDSRNRNTSDQADEKAVAEISMKDFLDFLKISYQVNEAIDNPSLDITEKGSVDWKKLTSDNLINRLKEREALLSKQKEKELQGNPENVSNPVGKKNSNLALKNTDAKRLEQKPLDGNVVENNTSCESLHSNASLDRKSEKLGLSRKKSHSFKKESSNESETSRSIDSADDRTPSRQLKKKLNEALQEGILDSLLPYLLPKPSMQDNSQPANKKPFSFDYKKAGSGTLDKSSGIGREKLELKRKYFANNDGADKNEKDVDIVIHVCDEIKNIKKDFKCSQKLLLNQMGYFSEVTAGQKLEEMDISVHCDITIFEWLMQWIQKDNLRKELWPVMDSTIAIPVLMSSAFLQINSLHEYCLQYCKSHINDVIRDSPNLNCLNDNALTRLCSLFSNTEVENITDKKDRLQSKLFCKLIVALTEPEAQPTRGHYSSLATIYRCSKCLKLILKKKSSSILCLASNLKMDRYGTVHSTHVYDSSWNLTDYIRDLRMSLKTWRGVYWRLWADCHFLFCQVCDEYFPVGHMNRCRFHIDSVQYFPVENQRSVFHSVGRYPCCGERAYRFETIKNNSGCQYRDHIIISKSTYDNEILRIWNNHKEIIKNTSSPSNEIDKNKVKKVVLEDGGAKKYSPRDGFWWEGLEIAPTKQQSGFLNKMWDSVIKIKDESKNAGYNSESKIQKSPSNKVTSTQQPNLQDTSSLSDSSDDNSSSSNGGNSEESFHGPKCAKPKISAYHGSMWYPNRMAYIRKERRKRKRKKKKHLPSKNDGNRFWVSKLSTRCNQDNQREFEERALRQIECVIAKKLSGESYKASGSRGNNQVVPLGGIYVKLEQEWREAHCFSHGCPGSTIKARGCASHVNINNSNFSVPRRSKSRSHR